MMRAPQNPTLNPALRSFWTTQADIKVLKGGRASSKTWDAAGFAVFLACRYCLKFLCMRQFQNKIAESVYAVLVVQIERFDLVREFDIQKSVIRHMITGAEFHFYGIHRDIAEIKGFEGADIGWIEEAEGLTKEQWGTIEPTLRKDGAEAWLIYNPRLVTDFIESFEHDPASGIIVRHINYDENPFLSATMIRKIERLKRTDYEEYQHIYLGVPKTDDDDVVIKLSWIQAAIDAHVKLGIEPSGSRRLGFDVADSGKDLCSQVYTHGIVTLWGELWNAREDELLKSCARVYGKAVELGADINYDSIGVGATCGAKFDEMNQAREHEQGYFPINYSKFIAGAEVENPEGLYIHSHGSKIKNREFFENLKAQKWWEIADRFRNTYNAVVNGEQFSDSDLISVSSNLPKLKTMATELSTPKRRWSKSGKVMVESKEEMAKRDIDSPNYGDGFIMSNDVPAVRINRAASYYSRRSRR